MVPSGNYQLFVMADVHVGEGPSMNLEGSAGRVWCHAKTFGITEESPKRTSIIFTTGVYHNDPVTDEQRVCATDKVSVLSIMLQMQCGHLKYNFS